MSIPRWLSTEALKRKLALMDQANTSAGSNARLLNADALAARVIARYNEEQRQADATALDPASVGQFRRILTDTIGQYEMSKKTPQDTAH
jgi:hypothetical protein